MLVIGVDLIMQNEVEMWKHVPGYNELYSASSFGRIRRNAGSVPHSHSVFITRKEKILTQRLASRGYMRVILSKDGKHSVREVHTLVWDSHGEIKRKGRKMVVDHKDNNPLNNNFSNLQCIQQRVNASKDRKRKYSKYTGVSLHGKSQKWEARIMVNRKSRRLGLYHNEIDAHNAYQNALSSVK